MKIILDIPPPRTTVQQHKISRGKGRLVIYEPKALKEARALLMEKLAVYRPASPLEGPLRLRVIFLFTRAKSGRQAGSFKVTRPDLDNEIKLLADCLTRSGIWHDDAQVSWMELQKRWAKKPGILIEIEQLTDALIDTDPVESDYASSRRLHKGPAKKPEDPKTPVILKEDGDTQ